MTEDTSRNPRNSELSFLARLDLEPYCTEAQVRSAYLKRAESVHPDRGGDGSVFRQLRRDYESALRYARQRRHRLTGATGQFTLPLADVSPPTDNAWKVLQILGIVGGLSCLVTFALGGVGVASLVFGAFVLAFAICAVPKFLAGMPPVVGGVLFLTLLFLVAVGFVRILQSEFGDSLMRGQLNSREQIAWVAGTGALLMLLCAVGFGWLFAVLETDR